MSDTPRTDAQVHRPAGGAGGFSVIDSNFARQLERELREVNEALDMQVNTSGQLRVLLDRAKDLLAESVRLMHEAKGPCSWPALDRLKVEIQKL